MALTAKHSRARWVVPILALAGVVAVPMMVANQASAESSLPPQSAEELLVAVQQVQPMPLSGEVRQVTELGLPEMPQIGGPHGGSAASLSPLSLASGTHTWRIWTDAEQSARLALVDGTQETSITSNGTDLWVWNSAERKAIHATVPAELKDAHSWMPGEADWQHPALTGMPTTPQEVAQHILAQVEPSTTIETGRSSKVAGHDAYELIAKPKDTASTKIGQVRIAIDSQTYLPLRVQVYAAGAGSPAIDVGFTSLSYAKPDASVFGFEPPAGAEVTEWGQDVSAIGGPDPEAELPSGMPNFDPQERSGQPDVSVIGEGWSRVLVKQSSTGIDPMAELGGSDSGEMGVLMGALQPVQGAWGSGRLFNGTLFSILLTDDGRIAAGFVPADQLYRALDSQ